jgi:hypothetical protein
LLQGNDKSITYIWHSTFNKLILAEDFNYVNDVFRVNEAQFYISYTNGRTLLPNCTLAFGFTCNLENFPISVDVPSAYDPTIINFQSLHQKCFDYLQSSRVK